MFLLLIFSCATESDIKRDIPDYSMALQTKIELLLKNKKYERVICYCKNIDDDRLKAFEVVAETKLQERYEKELEESNFNAAVESLKSLIAFGREQEIEPYDIYLKEVFKKIKNEEIMPALFLFKRTFIDKNLEIKINEKQYKILADSAIRMHDKAVLQYFRDKKMFSDYKSEEIKKVINKVYNTTEMISGTVTIWVDRGIKIEGGLGYPDRVIGSGFYIDPRGYLLTNYHVISSEVDKSYEGYSRLYIKYDENENKIPAKVIGWDKTLDVALLKVDYLPEYFFNFFEQGVYSPGEKIYAIGSPGGLGKTITSGIISISKNRRIVPIGDTIQVDVPINSGNSGGPIIDEKNNLIGMVFAGIEQFEGVNFVIPARWIINILPELYTGGKNPQTWLGLTAEMIKGNLTISYICPQTSIFETKIKAGDIIKKIDNVMVSDITNAQEIVQSKLPGSIIKLTIERENELFETYVLAEKRNDLPMKEAAKLDTKKKLFAPFFGMIIKEAEEEKFIKQYIIKEVFQGSIADETGLSVNDPFTIVFWNLDDKNDVIFSGIKIKKRKAGFLETTIQLGSYIDILNTI